MRSWALVLGVLVLVGVPIAGFLLWVKVFGGPDGERLQRRRMQGPFVPPDAEEIAEEESGPLRSSVEPHDKNG